MRKWLVGCAIAAALGLGGAAASAQTAGGAMASHSAMSSHMASSAGHAKETKTDVMMVDNCLKMPHDKMVRNAECKDYMKHHPDWMKHR